MGKALIIAEKPSVARDIAQALGGFTKNAGGEYESATAVISNAIGHLVTLSVNKDEDKGWELPALPCIPEKFTLEPIERTKAQLAVLGKLVRRADIDCVINACDAGREGELIFRLIYLILGCKKPMQRMWLQSMTPDAIRAAYKAQRTGQEMAPLFHAAISRAEADWLVGVNGTRALTKFREAQGKSEGVASAGRVQSPVLALVYDRELKIKNFVARDYFEVHGLFAIASGEYPGKWFNPKFVASGDEDAKADRLFDAAQARAIEAKCSGVRPSSVTEESQPTTSAPPKLFDLTTLQREANSKFGFSAKETLDIAQALYEKHKVLTYPRTDASALPEDYVDKARETMGQFAGTPLQVHADRVLTNGWIKQDKRIFDNDKISDHFAIIPTGARPNGLTEDESKIYHLVARRFIAIFHPSAEYLKTTRISIVSGEAFKSQGSVLVSEGWLVVYGKEASQSGDDAKTLCRLTPGEQAKTVEMKVVGAKTKPPERYTDATLLGAMENAGRLVDADDYADAMKAKGLGTPATRAATIEDLLSKGKLYLQREKKYLVPTTKAMEVIALLRSNGVEALTSPQLTGEWEYKLAQIEAGLFSRSAFMAEAKAMTQQIVDQFKGCAAQLPPSAAGSAGRMLDVGCPICKGEVRAGVKAYGCTSCEFKMWRLIAERAISETEAEALIRNRRTELLEGFVSSKKRIFSARLVFDEAYTKVSFEFPAAAPVVTTDVQSLGSCPTCKGGVYPAGENYVCEHSVGQAKTCDFRIWGAVAQRRIDATLASELLSGQRTELLSGFVSKKGRGFSAYLQLKDATLEMSFPD